MRVYIAGPMTGIAQYNFPAFIAAAERLRKGGYDVVSPAELDDPADRDRALASPDGAPQTKDGFGKSWGDFLARDVKLLADDGIEAIVVLDGWEDSRGARLETFVGKAMCGMKVYRIHPYWGGGWTLVEVADSDLYNAWAGINLKEWFA